MKYAQIEWNNGTPRSTEFGDVYFSAADGVEETRYVFLQQNELSRRWLDADSFVIAETGFGTGLNFLVTMMAWLESAADDACLHFISIENHPVSPADIARLSHHWPALKPFVDELLLSYPPPVPGMHLIDLAGGKVRLYLVFDEVEHALEQIDYKVDAWYLDGFAPARNPHMWNERVFELIGRHTCVGGSFATYTAAGVVRRGLASAGFVVQKVPGYADKRDMLKGFIFEQSCYLVDRPWFTIPARSFNEKSATIIGAGLAGLAAAWSLVRRGWKITLIDRHETVAEEASGNSAGLLMPRLTQDKTIDARFYANAFSYSVQCLDRLQSACSEQFWFKTGNVLVDDGARLKKIIEIHQYPENFIRYLGGGEAGRVTGIDLDRDALFFVDAGWVNVKLLCEAIKRECGNRLEFIQSEVANISLNHERWTVTDDSDAPIALTECLLLANGAQAKMFSVLDWLPVSSVRGQLTSLKHTDKSRNLQCGISAERYVTPASDGVHVVGASYNLDDESAVLTITDQQHNIDKIDRLLPGLFQQQDELAGRVAFRAVSEDRVPVVGCVPDSDAFQSDYHDLQHGRQARQYPPGKYLPGLYVSTAHGSRGLASCFISAETIAAIICNEPVPLEKDVLDYLNPARFIIRKLKRGLSSQV
ncbi:MAG: bifunctional tRNA (5-methylaminomethyl-2-thiouridine)(34)-methyltransferase MnmD/FAD-dependent 5-carboxymethylaminomethyl-2-thiouridine(34) oxidoreductase MnmC [Gammaproteobacteria bacterium]|jgi:tRNA 5-methylaminomethyl-2-thiouridine biosynthesis bifunctional protein